VVRTVDVHAARSMGRRATSDPALLGDLFRLDHVTTRMRRHAEGLLILAGATPGRGWRDPVPIVDVLQAAVAEIEDYVRVDVIAETSAAVTGNAVNDVIHLIAELVENATAFSPPVTRVTITGGSVGRGFAVEIEDRGLGMAPEIMAEINEQLASPPEFDLANSEQLGLFVAGQLAARHGITVTLRRSPYGGTTAIVLLPTEIITSEPEESSWFWPGGSVELPPGAVNGSAHEAGTAGDRNRGQAFGMTGRHRLAPSSPGTDGQANGSPGTDGMAGSELPPVGTRSWLPELPSPAADRQTGPAGITEPAKSPGSDGANGHSGSGVPNGSGPGRVANGTAGGGTYRGLPRRVRQAHLAPQLRGLLGTPTAEAPHQADGPAGRPPEQTGSLMSAMQAGWLRGRLDDLEPPDAGLGILGGRPSGGSGGEAGSDDREDES
jgi:histidine kinase/DNA gyrase B/HSP90-like ATPase